MVDSALLVADSFTLSLMSSRRRMASARSRMISV